MLKASLRGLMRQRHKTTLVAGNLPCWAQSPDIACARHDIGPPVGSYRVSRTTNRLSRRKRGLGIIVELMYFPALSSQQRLVERSRSHGSFRCVNDSGGCNNARFVTKARILWEMPLI